MIQALLLQLPVPQLNFGHKTGNIPFAAACISQAASSIPDTRVEILPQVSASYMGDAALLGTILDRRPDIIGFSTYVWNVKRVLYLVKEIKACYSPLIVIGGPEVTDDNPLLIDNPMIDFCVQGEGEELFARLLQEPELWSQKFTCADGGKCFCSSPSPYLSTPLKPDIENFMLLETMRGCPYGCAYCYYGKSRNRSIYKDNQYVLDAIKWAISRDVEEVYFLDPSLDRRPDLKSLLREIAHINRDRHLSLISEIRAEAVDEDLADLLQAAGFTWFEIGLQSTNPDALALMNRKSDPDRFVKGVHALKKRGITTEIDLIAGLPGDDPKGFENTINFLIKNSIHDDVQVFPLSVLPGTEFRRNAEQLGLVYDLNPPYTVFSTPSFSSGEILDAVYYAGHKLDMSMYPLPDMDLAWKTGNFKDMGEMEDVRVSMDGHSLNYKVWLHNGRSTEDLAQAAKRVTHPYQLLIPPSTGSPEFVERVLSIFTSANPHTPMEMIFYDPPSIPSVERLLEASHIERPHYLDGEQRPLYEEAGNRAIMFTIVTSEMNNRFYGPMQRHVYWWKRAFLPDMDMINSIEEQGFDGILADVPLSFKIQQEWQDMVAEQAGDLIQISFSRIDLNKSWLMKTMPGTYNFSILP